ncbi:MAG: protein kinase [Planctomycetota bacterium]
MGPLGAGATSTVELARLAAPWAGLELGTVVAVKRLLPALALDPRACAALRAEAEIGGRVRHGSLVRVLACGEDDEGPLLVMDYVPGRTLAERLSHEGALPEAQLRQVGMQLAGALAALHAEGVVHGDLKPENVRLDLDGRAVLLDLGLARSCAGLADAHADGGSLPYLAPERAQGRPAGTPADVFALGVVLYELATGVHPYDPRAGGLASGPITRSSGRVLPRALEEEGADALLAALATARPTAPSALSPELSPFLDAVLLQMLARAPEERPSAAELASILDQGEAGSWWRTEVGSDDTRLARRQHREAHDTPLVGRDQELAALRALFATVLSDGRGAVAWLVGPAGSGKWRLAREFAARARLGVEPPIYLYGRWTETAETRSGGALSLLLHRWLQLPPGRAPRVRERARLEALVSPDTAALLEAALDPSPDARFPDSVGVALADWLAALSRERPLVVFLDDLHRAGAVTLDALGTLVARLHRMRVLLVAGSRDEVSGQNPEALGQLTALITRAGEDSGEETSIPVERVELGPLTVGAVTELVRRVFHRTVPRLRLSEVLWQRSRGNPGLVDEILHELVNQGSVEPAADGALRLLIAPDELPMPASLQTLIAARLRGLEPELRRWLERLAIVGGRIEPDFLLRAFPPTTREEIDELFPRLVREGWLVPAGQRYRFARPALREAIYRTMQPARRVRLHAAAARGLEPAEGNEVSAGELFQRAFHLRAAEEHKATLELVLGLIVRLRRRASAQRMLILARWGLEAVDAMSGDPVAGAARLSLLETAADAADRLGVRDEERELLDRLVEMDVDADADPASAARLYLLHGRYAAGTGQFGLARGFLRNAMQLVEQGGPRPLRGEIKRRLGAVQAQIGELADARQLAQEALGDAAEASHRALAHLAIALVDTLEDRFEQGLDRIGACLTELRAEGAPPLGILGFASLLRARLLRSIGRSGRALGAARRAVRLAERAGERRFEVEARARLGALLVDLDRAEEAEVQLRDALLSSREIEDRRGQVIAESWLGILLWEADDPSSRAAVERATESAREIGFYRAEALALAILARIHRAGGDLAAAQSASGRSAELVYLYGAEMVDRIVCLGTRALVLSSGGRGGEGRTLVRELRRHMRRENGRIRSNTLRRGQRAYSTRLLELVLSADGPVYPRAPGAEEAAERFGDT